MKKSFAQIVEDVKNAERRKMTKKIPEWEGKDIIIPSGLSLEQCSSSETARYKAELISEHLKGKSIDTVCDITGGLGADSMEGFSRIAKSVHYFESQKELTEAARHNAEVLGIENIVFHNESIGSTSILPKADLIYADPSRRSASGKKVFLLEDCSPNILQILPMLFDSSPLILFKLSPISDISMLSSCFGENLSEIHVVSSGGEVKELLCLLERVPSERPLKIVVAETLGKETFAFNKDEERKAEIRTAKEITAGDILVEPCAGILKSGAFKLACNRFPWNSVSLSTHLYVQSQNEEKQIRKTLLFKFYNIKECLPFSKSTIELLSKRGMKADVTVKNLKGISSDELQKRLHCSSSDESRFHIFACNTLSGAKIIVSQRLLPK